MSSTAEHATVTLASHPALPSVPESPHYLSEAECQDIARRVARASQGGGYTTVELWSTWTGHVRWARNKITSAGEVRNDYVRADRNLQGAHAGCFMLTNDTSDVGLVALVRRAERLARLQLEEPQGDLLTRLQLEPAAAPQLFFEATDQLDTAQRAQAALALAQRATATGLLSAGYIEVGAHSMALIDTLGHTRYFKYTTARFSVTVRDPKAHGSGWAGGDHPDWSKLDETKLTDIAMDKCLRSRNPVAVEPGRYTTILEPQAVCDFVGQLVQSGALLLYNEQNRDLPTKGPFGNRPENDWRALKGQKIVDERITITADPMDPELAFPPFNLFTGTVHEEPVNHDVYHPVTWIDRGVLTTLAYDRARAIDLFQRNLGAPNSGAFRMSGGETSIEEMIATTKRGLLVTRFANVRMQELQSLLCRGYTRDGLWLIEDGKISKPIKNMVFTESVLFALNNIEQLGVPQRAFHPLTSDTLRFIPQPVIVPPLKIEDFSFTALSEAI